MPQINGTSNSHRPWLEIAAFQAPVLQRQIAPEAVGQSFPHSSDRFTVQTASFFPIIASTTEPQTSGPAKLFGPLAVALGMAIIVFNIDRGPRYLITGAILTGLGLLMLD